DLRPTSRTSVVEYRDTRKNIRQIAEELGVETVMEGGVQRAGDRVLVSVQLIDARTDEHIWA
ncbi:MAG: adenylate/guanylate cyclase domain-containing protein, partial [Anaerolineae bacterium]|nr:adenylate/guanylate cyclase domain-containing protein [Anaerolineae bacterium]